MHRPGFVHLRGSAAWEHCDHEWTRVHRQHGTVRLAQREAQDEVRVTSGVFAAWDVARGGAVALPCPADRCEEQVVLVWSPDGTLHRSTPDGWEPVATAPPVPSPEHPLRFAEAEPVAPGSRFGRVGAAALDPKGRIWLLERATSTLQVRAPGDLRLVDTVRPPSDTVLVDIGTTAAAVLAIGATGGTVALWRQPWGGDWARVELDGVPEGYVAVSIGGGTADRALGVLRGAGDATPLAVVVEGERAHVTDLPELEDPLHVLGLPSGSFLVAEVSGPPGTRTELTEMAVEGGELVAVQGWIARRFDGRGLLLDACGEPRATHGTGLAVITPYLANLVSAGRVETFALDSERFGCQWHRVFIDVCLPPGTSVEVSARTADEPWPDPVRRLPRPPRHASGSGPVEDWWVGSRAPQDEEGWVAVGALDRRRALADIPHDPIGRALPSGDARNREPDDSWPIEFDTLEGLLKNGPGRYLWLRITLRGTRRRSPEVLAVRASQPRPSLLDHLPSYWRGDPEAARQMDEMLALFEGPLTELDARVEVFRYLLGAVTAPADGLDWLAGFVALQFDRRLDEGVRRQLLLEAVDLYRWRGTPSGLERLVGIIARAEVKVLEAFRVRARTGSVLGTPENVATGAPGSVLGPGMQLGGPDALAGGEWEGEPWEKALLAAQERLAGDPRPCPEDTDAVVPLDLDPLISFYRKYAHRFSVVVFRPREAILADVIEATVEAAKPAHTVHEICWLDAGFQVGMGSIVGFGTRIAGRAETEPLVVGQVPLGMATTLSTPDPSSLLGTFVGASRVGASTRAG